MRNSTDECIPTTFCVSKRHCTPFSLPVNGLDGRDHYSVWAGPVQPEIVTSLVKKAAGINTQVTLLSV